MKKAVKTFGGLLLVLLFGAGIMLYVNTYQKNAEKEEETKKESSIKAAKQTFELKEDAEILNIVYNVSEAELIEDYDKIDAYYKNREYLLSPYEFIKTYYGGDETSWDEFPQDIRLFRVKYSVTNNGDAEIKCSPEELSVNSIIDGKIEEWEFDCYDVRVLSENGNKDIALNGKKPYWNEDEKKTDEEKEEEKEKQKYTLAPSETIELEFVGERQIFNPSYMYVTERLDSPVDDYDLYLMKNPSTQKIHLNIAGSFGSETKEYMETREIQKMKYESWTNLEQKKWREDYANKMGFPGGSSYSDSLKEIVESSEPGQHFVDIFYQKIGKTEGELTSGFYLDITVDDFQIIEWKDLPSVYIEQGNMQNMAKRYQSVHGYGEEELKVLLLTLSFASSKVGTLEPYEQTLINYFYGRSALYTKDEERMYLFGAADDWTVLSNSGHPEDIGPINFVVMDENETVTVQMAYILPPALYEESNALYFTGEYYVPFRWDTDTMPLTKIELK